MFEITRGVCSYSKKKPAWFSVKAGILKSLKILSVIVSKEFIILVLQCTQLQYLRTQSKDSGYVGGSCGTSLSTLRNTYTLCGVDNRVPQLPQT